MKAAKLCLGLALVAALSTHAAAVELVNPLQVLERSRRAGIEFDQRMKRDAAEQKKRENEQKAQREKQEQEQKAQQEAQRKREREQKAEADAQRKREITAAKGKAGASSSAAKVTPAQHTSDRPALMTVPAQPTTDGTGPGEHANEPTN